MKKIWFFILLLITSTIFSACKKNVSQQQENERLLGGINQIVTIINDAFLWENSLFSGRGELNLLSSNLTIELILTGNLLFSGQELDWNIDLFVQQTGTELGNQLVLSFVSQIRKSGKDLYFFPKNFVFSQGAGNIQSKFLQLILDGLLDQRVKVGQIQFPFSWIVKKLPQIPQCFSGSKFQTEVLNDYLSWQGDKVQFLSWNIKTEDGKRLFEQMVWKVNKEELIFSGYFDGKKLKWKIEEWRNFPLEIEFAIGKNKLFCSGKWGTKFYQATLSILDNQGFKLQWQLWKGENEQEKSEFSFYFYHIQQTWALQSLPNTYISLEKYLEGLNISF